MIDNFSEPIRLDRNKNGGNGGGILLYKIKIKSWKVMCPLFCFVSRFELYMPWKKLLEWHAKKNIEWFPWLSCNGWY